MKQVQQLENLCEVRTTAGKCLCFKYNKTENRGLKEFQSLSQDFIKSWIGALKLPSFHIVLAG